MPKIIANLEARLVEEAWRQLKDGGYEAVTIRSVATACGVGVGTVYNYFDSKEELLAAYLMEDWNRGVAAIESVSAENRDPEAVARCIYDQISGYCQRHLVIFRDPAAAKAYSSYLGKHHRMLRTQLARPLRMFVDSDFAAEFAAEALLTWTLAGKEFHEIYGMIRKLL